MNGVIFDVGNNTTSGLNLNKFLQVLGEDRFDSGPDVDFNPSEFAPATEGIQTGGNIEQNYFDSVSTLHRFGFAAAGKGIDVSNPDPRNKQAIQAAQIFREMANDSELRLAELKTGREVEKMYQELLADPNLQNFTGGLPTDRAANFEDLKGFVNKNAFDTIESAVTDINATYAKGDFQTASDVSEANSKLNAFRSGLDSHKATLTKLGIPNDVATEFLSRMKQLVGTANFDAKSQSEIEENNAQANQANAGARENDQQANAARALADLRDRTDPKLRSSRSGGQSGTEAQRSRAEAIVRVQNGNISGLEGHPAIKNVEVKEQDGQRVLNVDFKSAGKESISIPISEIGHRTDSGLAINNLFDDIAQGTNIADGILAVDDFSDDQLAGIADGLSNQINESPNFTDDDLNDTLSKDNTTEANLDTDFFTTHGSFNGSPVVTAEFIPGSTRFQNLTGRGGKNRKIKLTNSKGEVKEYDLLEDQELIKQDVFQGNEFGRKVAPRASAPTGDRRDEL
jgi:hypothetical protein